MSPHDAGRVPASRPLTRTILLTTLVTLFFSGAPIARVDLCGTTIVADFTLDQDLNCTGDGLIVAADDITITLEGYTITGDGGAGDDGLEIVGRTGISVKGGTFVNFAAGIRVNASTDIDIKDATFRGNTDGIDLQAGSTGITIKANTFLDNRARGIMNRGGTSGNDIKNNYFLGNRVGILLFGPIGITVKDNYIASSVQFGMRVNFPATGNLIKGNIVTSHPAGIDFIPNPVGGAGAVGNTFLDNTISSNTCGLSGPMGGNTFQDNQLVGNTTDVCGP